MRYKLYFRRVLIGDVVESDSDFPNVYGVISFADSVTHPASVEDSRVARFLDLSRESTRLVNAEHDRDVSIELRAVNLALIAFNEYIFSNDWRLVDESGEALPILCPMVHDSDEIVWRWNPSAPKSGPCIGSNL